MDPALLPLLDDLASPGRTLAFCDETNLTEGATATLVANLRLHAAFVLDSSAYASVSGPLADFLAAGALPEFHAAEIVNGKAGSPWKAVPMPVRLDAYQHISNALQLAGSRIAYLRISKGEYDAMVVQSGGAIPTDYKEGLKRVFLSSMAEYLPRTGASALIVDRGKNTPGPTLCTVAGGSHLFGGGAILVESHKVIGLQLADMAAYVVRRYLLRKGKIGESNSDAFDEITTATVASFEGRFDHLLETDAPSVCDI